MTIYEYLPSKETVKYDLQILGAILIGLPAYFDQLPILGPKAQQVLVLASIVWGLATGMARPNSTPSPTTGIQVLPK